MFAAGVRSPSHVRLFMIRESELPFAALARLTFGSARPNQQLERFAGVSSWLCRAEHDRRVPRRRSSNDPLTRRPPTSTDEQPLWTVQPTGARRRPKR